MSSCLLLILVLSFSWQAQAAEELKPYLENNLPLVAASSNRASGSFTLVTELGGNSKGDSVDTPNVVYVPLATNEGGVETLDFTTVVPADRVPIMSAGIYRGYLASTLEVSNDTANTLYLQVAMKKNDGGYRVVSFENQLAVTVDSGTTNTLVAPEISMNKMCNNGAVCNEDNKMETRSVFLFYFFTSTIIGDLSDLSSITNYQGIHYKLLISDKVETTALIEINPSPVVGDRRLTINFQASPIPDAYLIASFVTTVPGESITQEFTVSYQECNQSPCIPLKNFHAYATSGQISILNLDNDQTYYISLALVNKFQFASFLSPTVVGAPEKIDVFVDKQACYLLSAGLQREHFLLNYFRTWRDEVFLKTQLGTNAVFWYYQHARPWTGLVMNSRWLSGLIIVSAYLVYYFLHYFFLWLLLIILGIIIKKNDKKGMETHGRP